jgi:hypothetical protein
MVLKGRSLELPLGICERLMVMMIGYGKTMTMTIRLW